MSKDNRCIASYLEGFGWILQSDGTWVKFDRVGRELAAQGDEIWKKDLREAITTPAGAAKSGVNGAGSRADAEA